MGEVLHAAHAQAGTYHVCEHGVFGTDDQVTAPHQHQRGGEYRAMDLRDGDLSQIAPPFGALKKIVPFLVIAGLHIGQRGTASRPQGKVRLAFGVLEDLTGA